MLILKPEIRSPMWQHTIDSIENYINSVHSLNVAPDLNVEDVRNMFQAMDFETPMDPIAAIDFAVHGFKNYQTHTPHRRYFGLFNPAPSTMGIVADSLVAAFNPQLAAWSHNPFAVELEQHLIRMFGVRFGYDPSAMDGTFTSGGAEANHTAVLTALTDIFPEFARKGLRGLSSQPVFYGSTESHHSFVKASRFCGLGTEAHRRIEVNDDLQMDLSILKEQIRKDKENGFVPFLIVGTGGTTNAGVVDPLTDLADLAAEQGLWFHVDAAWGGAAVLVPELKSVLKGIERSDSITFDSHKWLSVPNAAGMFLTKHPTILDQTCHIEAEYVPKDSEGLGVTDPLSHSLQWSRRMIGLKVFLSLAVAGWKGYENTIRHQTEMGNLLRQELQKADWKVVNPTILPVICFVDAKPMQNPNQYYADILSEVLSSGKVWISTTQLGGTRSVLRACITNVLTDADDIRILIHELDGARQKIRGTL